MIKGLSNIEVKERISKGLTNQSKEDTSLPLLSIILQNVSDLPTIIIFLSVLFLIIYGQFKDAGMVSIIISINIIVGIVQEIRARNMLRKLKILRQDKVLVIRDGKEIEIDNKDIVLDDFISIKSGQYIYVDGKLIENDHLLLDESILTGESDYVKKEVESELLSGSFVTAGKGIYQATKVGTQSTLNKMTSEAKKYVNSHSPLQNNISNISKILLFLTIGTLSILFIKNYIDNALKEVELIGAVVSIVTAMIPQGVILTVTLSLTLGTIRMAKKNILVQKLNAVETLAGVKVICMDKTGTITQNKLSIIDTKNVSDLDDKTYRSIISNYCNKTLEKNKTIKALESEFAIIDADTDFKVINEMPFNSKIKQSGIEAEFKNKQVRVILGSYEAILKRLSPTIETDPLEKLNTEYTSKGYRNLFMVYKFDFDSKILIGEESDNNYLPLAFVSMEDKLRDNAGEIINGFIERGVRPVIISGDNPNTLQSLMSKLQIEELKNVITGSELAKISDQNELQKIILLNDIFARVTPEQKVQIIKAFQSQYKYVGMMGDGVNDALAIKQANLGIALGSGADATKNIADAILLDDNLLNLNEVIIEGRRIIYNSRRGAQLILGKNIYTLVIITIALLLSLPFPFNTRGLFILSFFISSFSILFMLGDNRTPPANENFLKQLYNFMFSAGITAGLIGLFILYNFSQNSNMQTILVSFLILTGQFNYLFSLHNEKVRPSIKDIQKKSFLVIFLIIGYLLCMYIPVLSNEFFISPLNISEWGFIIILITIYATAFNLVYSGIKKLF
jgi:cation-transporting ATPase E